MRISTWSSDVCSSALAALQGIGIAEQALDDARIDIAAKGVLDPFLDPHLAEHVVERPGQLTDLVARADVDPGLQVTALDRSDARRVGTECVSTCISRLSPQP